MKLNKCIIVKYSELHLKGNNKNEFLNILVKNINSKFEKNNIDANAINGRDRVIINSNNDFQKAYLLLKYIVGISSFYYYYEIETNKENIEKVIKENIGDINQNTTFRINAKLINNNLFESKDKMIEWLAWFGINKLGMKINLSNYDIEINVKINDKKTFIFLNKEIGILGLPAGVNGKALSMLSGGIDSPVAAFKTITRGINVSFVTFLTPRTAQSEVINKIKDLAKTVNKFNGIDGKLFLVNFELVQEEIMKLKNSSYRIILLRRFFMKFSQMISKKYKYKFIITGDSLGQVASQTPESMTQIDNATEQLVVRPLVSMSKNEIIKISKEIKTYNISIRKGEDMCLNFVPKDPIIFPKKEKVNELESLLNNMDKIMEKVFNKDMRVIELKEL